MKGTSHHGSKVQGCFKRGRIWWLRRPDDTGRTCPVSLGTQDEETAYARAREILGYPPIEVIKAFEEAAFQSRIQTATQRAISDRKESKRDPLKRAVLYFIRSSGKVKIGVSTDLKKRIATYVLHNPQPLVLLRTFEMSEVEAYEQEHLIKNRLRRFHHHGEWFRIGKTELESIFNLLEKPTA